MVKKNLTKDATIIRKIYILYEHIKYNNCLLPEPLDRVGEWP